MISKILYGIRIGFDSLCVLSAIICFIMTFIFILSAFLAMATMMWGCDPSGWFLWSPAAKEIYILSFIGLAIGGIAVLFDRKWFS